jgi:hypothetical protein
LICDYRVLTEIAYDEQLICKEKSVSELNVWVWLVFLINFICGICMS